MGLGVFIEPRDELKTNILSWKDRVMQELSYQPYCSHPPHSTLIHTNVTQEAKAQEETRKALNSFPAFGIETDGSYVFLDDRATGGGHTLIWKIRQIKELNELQLLVAEALKPLLAENSVPAYVKANPLLRESFALYGFPFIGSHWIPHMTIASLKTEDSHPLIEAFLCQSETFPMEVNEVSCWRIENDQHILLERITLQ